jgi:hypothetical protein
LAQPRASITAIRLLAARSEKIMVNVQRKIPVTPSGIRGLVVIKSGKVSPRKAKCPLPYNYDAELGWI